MHVQFEQVITAVMSDMAMSSGSYSVLHVSYGQFPCFVFTLGKCLKLTVTVIRAAFFQSPLPCLIATEPTQGRSQDFFFGRAKLGTYKSKALTGAYTPTSR